jgi:hypothetical protein
MKISLTTTFDIGDELYYVKYSNYQEKYGVVGPVKVTDILILLDETDNVCIEYLCWNKHLKSKTSIVDDEYVSTSKLEIENEVKKLNEKNS